MDGITNSMDMRLSKLQETVKEGSLACCSPWVRKESDTTEPLNSKNKNHRLVKAFESKECRTTQGT